MSIRSMIAAAAIAFVAVPLAGTSHAGCTQDLAGTTPRDPHSITQTYIAASQAFVACAV